MGQSVKELIIRINGQVGSGASKVASWLGSVGTQLEELGRYTAEFQKESVDIYRNYEDQMLATKFALSAQVESATELEKQMEGLDKAAQKWAASTIFHTDDVAKAITEAARAGWEYEEILEGIPQAMLIAQAGGMDLSQGLDYLVKIMNATRTPMENMGKVTDQWAKASNLSATSIGEMGEAFLSLGAAATFGDSTEELFAMLAALANVGTTGTRAGTALRSAMMRLVAPTTKAEAAMEILGADTEELAEVLADESVTKASKILQGIGFSAYTTEGKLKPMKDIFAELFELTKGMEDTQRNEVMSAIFPTRTIATALALLHDSNGELDSLYTKIQNSEGYAQTGAEIMMSGLTGAIETLESKWEEFKRKIGETMAPEVEKVSGFLGNIVDTINGLDPEMVSGITAMLTALSAGGALAGGAAAVVKMAAALGPLGLATVVAGLGVSFLVGYLNKLNDIQFEEKFGTLKVDLQELGEYTDSLKTKFDLEQQLITGYSAAVQEAQESYNEAVGQMNEGLLKKILTGGTIEDSDFAEFTALGEKITKATVAGIKARETGDLTLLQAMFGSDLTDEQGRILKNTAGIMDKYYGGLEAEAYQIGESIRQQLTLALHNGELTADDRKAIQKQVDRLNEINAGIADRMEKQAYNEQLLRASRVSWETASGFMEENEAKMNQQLQAMEKEYLRMEAEVITAYDDAMKNGQGTFSYTVNGQEVTLKATKAEKERAVAELEHARQTAHDEIMGKYGGLAENVIGTLLGDNMADAWGLMTNVYKNGGWEGLTYNADGSINMYSLFGGRSREQLDSLLTGLESLQDGTVQQKVLKLLNPYVSQPAIYAMMRSLETGKSMDLAGILQGYLNDADEWVNQEWGEWTESGFSPYSFNELDLRERLDTAARKMDELTAKRDDIQRQIRENEQQLAHGNVNAWQTLTNAERNAATYLYGTWAIDKYTGGGLYDQLPQVNAEIEATSAEIQKLQKELSNVQVHLVIDDSEVQNYQPPKFVAPVPRFAKGGRATSPSIFGEAGAEWAIPEEHSEPTAELLDAARRASGFTWGDLLGRFGGLNANPANTPVVLNYSPVIHAADANGVASVLEADKGSVLRMIREALKEVQYRESIEAYA